ncbi:glycoside hydrolase family 3 N-terminal domain-containing protein [Dysgonomonas sp. BGC7]|uniref:glycoside hydrolase family 3 N-terminal domain-containing protein n=1 Tax=Dysgonomonas sp. BGC7 TaxID=1658008 RepID=UPI0006808E33|nr:glycoside hydrolase family 3 N-terminal domain-containing protein [Dysgonomonas sp. BGC7]MBD8387304.1 serine hydrolase [Dysgonomonas sp. BGC7]
MKIKYIFATSIAISFFCLSIKALDNKRITPSLYKEADRISMTKWVDSIYNQMSTDQRIGQLFMPVVLSSDNQTNRDKIVSLVENQHVGGLLFSKSTPVEQLNLTNVGQSVSKVPLMISLDGEWGLSMRLSNTTQFPRNMMLGAIQNDSLLYYYGLEVARQCRLMGIHVNFAPVLDVNSNPDNPVIGNRSFGEDPERVARLSIMYSKGLEAGGVMAVAKHFPGHGDTSTDSHKVLPVIQNDKDRLEDVELRPFKEYIKEGLSGMMVAHLNIPALDAGNQPSSLSSAIATDLLQTELGFSGLIFTDGLQMKGVSGEENYCVRALLAGNDILLGPVDPVKDYESVKKAVADSVLSDSLLEAKCKKVLMYKYILHINEASSLPTDNLLQNLNNANADWINRELNKASVTLLKDDENIIPLKKLNKRKIAAVAIGENADNTFHNMLKNYADVSCFTASDANALLKLKKDIEPYNTVIVSVHTTRTNADAAIRTVTQGKETILTFFVVPYRMATYAASVKAADGVLLAYEGTDLAQDYAAQAIFGGNKTDGKIPVSVKGLFKEGKGLKTKKVRLSYEVPEALNIPSYRFNAIDTIVNESINAQAFPGCQVLVAKSGVIIYNRSFGSFEYDGKRKVTNSDIYDIASMTKASATVPAIMKLYDESEIKLSTPLSTYIKALKHTNKVGITVREALLHETGLPSFIPYYMDAIDKSSYEGRLFNRTKTPLYSAQFDESTWARVDYKFKPNLVSSIPKAGFLPLAEKMYVNKAYQDTIVKAIADSKLRKRKTYFYSCLNFMLLKEVVEDIATEDLNTFLQKSFFMKLGATTTTYNPLSKFDKNRIVPTEKDDFLRKQLLQGYVHDEGAAFMGGVSGNAGLFSNANDLAKLYQMWLNKGTYGGERYLSEKTCQLFTTTKSSSSRRGLGFDKPEMRTNKSGPTSISTPASTYGHTGFTGTCFWVDPDNDLIYIFLSNRVNEKRTHKQLMTLGIRQRIQEEIYKALRKSKSTEELTDNKSNTETEDEQTDTE